MDSNEMSIPPLTTIVCGVTVTSKDVANSAAHLMADLLNGRIDRDDAEAQLRTNKAILKTMELDLKKRKRQLKRRESV